VMDCFAGICSHTGRARCRTALVIEPMRVAEGAEFVCRTAKLSGGGSIGGFSDSRSVNVKAVSLQLLMVTDTSVVSVWPCAARAQAAASVTTATRFVEQHDIRVPFSNLQLWALSPERIRSGAA
jgi:hypothetical protein